MADIEKDFDEIADEINNKIQKAARALKEANELASKFNLQTLHLDPRIELSDYDVEEDDEEYHIEIIDRISFRPLLDEMNRAGWLTSGFEC